MAHSNEGAIQETGPTPLSLDELEAAAGFFAPVLLALFHARVARQESASAELFSKLFIHLDEGAGDAELDRAGLARNATAVRAGEHVVASFHGEVHERAVHQNVQNGAAQIFAELAAVDRDLALAGA